MLYIIEVGRAKHEEYAVVDCKNIMEAENFGELNRSIMEYKYAFVEAPSRSELAYAKYGRPLSMLDKDEMTAIEDILEEYLDEEFYYDINVYDENNPEHRRVFELQDRIPFGKGDII